MRRAPQPGVRRQRRGPVGPRPAPATAPGRDPLPGDGGQGPKRLGQSNEFIRLVSNAKRAGGIDALYLGRDPQRTPWYLTTAISHALTVLGWYELPDTDRPPERIWLDDAALNDHFHSVQERYRGDGGDSQWQAIPDQELEQNEFTRGRS